MNEKSLRRATCVIKKAIDDKPVSPNSKIQEARILHAFERFLKSTDTPDQLSYMTLPTLEAFQHYLLERGRKVKTIRCYTSTIIHMLKRIGHYQGYGYDFAGSGLANFRPVANKVSRNERKKKQIALTDEEVISLYSLPLQGVEEEVRDVFVCQCLLGQRIGDMGRLFAHEYTVETVNGVEVISFVQQKTKERAVIPLLPVAREILEKYKQGFRHINFTACRFDNSINRRIKTIGRKAGLAKEVHYSEQMGAVVVEKVNKQYELLHTHTARHTFVTIMCRLGVRKETLIIATGHTDTKMVEDVYAHLNSEDHTRAIVEAFSGLSGEIFNMGAVKNKTNVSLPSTTPFAFVILADFQQAQEMLSGLSPTTVVVDMHTEERKDVLHQAMRMLQERE